jgi:hypothetical protein
VLSTVDHTGSLTQEPPDLVWDGISENLAGLVSIWWEDDRTRDLLNAFRRVEFHQTLFTEDVLTSDCVESIYTAG